MAVTTKKITTVDTATTFDDVFVNTNGTLRQITKANFQQASGLCKELTQAQYNALSTAEKNNGTIYYITDADGEVIDATARTLSEQNKQNIATNKTNIATNKTNIATNTAAIATLNSSLETEIYTGAVSKFLSSLKTLGNSMAIGSSKHIKYTPSETTGKFVNNHLYGGLFERIGSNYWAISLADPEGNPVYGMYRNGTWIWDRIAIGTEVDALNSRITVAVTAGENVTIDTNKSYAVGKMLFLLVKGHTSADVNNAELFTISNGVTLNPTDYTFFCGTGSAWSLTGIGYCYVNGNKVNGRITSGQYFHICVTIPIN